MVDTELREAGRVRSCRALLASLRNLDNKHSGKPSMKFKKQGSMIWYTSFKDGSGCTVDNNLKWSAVEVGSSVGEYSICSRKRGQ